MIPQYYRLQLRKEKTFFSTAKRLSTPNFSLFFTKSTDRFKTTVLVSKKVAAQSVRRNRIKRVVRSIITGVFKDFINCPYLVVVVVKSSIVTTTSVKIRQELSLGLEKICIKS
jgi:ribonuclease P protein component